MEIQEKQYGRRKKSIKSVYFVCNIWPTFTNFIGDKYHLVRIDVNAMQCCVLLSWTN